MKKSYIYREQDLIKKPFLNIFLKTYNDRHINNKSYAVAQKLQKDQKLIDPYAKEVLIFYDPAVEDETVIKERIQTIRRQILINLKGYLENATVSLATTDEIIKHQTAANKESFSETDQTAADDLEH